MKTKLTTLLILASLYITAQNNAEWVYVTPNKDTLYLEQEDPTADLTFTIWKSDATWQGWNPVIVRAPREYIAYRRRTNVIELK
jgi:hypothetical protein